MAKLDHSEIIVGGEYHAKIDGKLSVVKVTQKEKGFRGIGRGIVVQVVNRGYPDMPERFVLQAASLRPIKEDLQ